MKTTFIKIVVFLTFLFAHFSIYAQYKGGNSDGASLDIVTNTLCSSMPPSFFAYLGGNADGASVNDLLNTSCGIAPSQYAFLGGNADGAATEELTATACGIPPSFFAFFGGTSEGAAVETLEVNACPFPPSFYAFFGGENDGSVVDNTAPVCPTQPPMASFTASATEICVGQSVTFTDTSTNIPAGWTWTFVGGTPNSSTVQNPVITYNTAGSFAVTLVAANYNGTDTITLNGYINVYAYPVVTSTTPASRCDAGTLVLNATTNVGTLNWYANPTGGTTIATGTSFTTPNITTTTTYYVESLNGVCSSTRVPVIATVNTTPTITSTTPASRCDTGSVTLNATSSAGNTVWYANPTGGTALATTNNFVTPLLSTSTTYYVEATAGSCTSTRTPVTATINTTPIITSTTPASRCDSGTVTLSAIANSGTLNWYANSSGGTSLATGGSFTTPSLNTTTTYFVDASNANCTSARIAVTATVNTTPTITSTSPNSRCDSGTVILSASVSAGNVVWYANATGGTALATTSSFTTPSISVTTTYYVEAVNGSCASETRTPVTATVNNSPTITSTTPTTICSGDTFTIYATASAGSLAWYNVPTGGLVQGSGNSFSLSNWNSTTTFYVQATDGSCQSARIPVVVTVNERPFNTTLTPASRCGTGAVTLAATYTVGTVNWFTNSSGGTAIATGSSFTTPSIATTTTYYVEAENNGCISTIRTAITATVYEVPVITSASPASRCGIGSVQLQATANVGSINWYANATGGSSLTTGGIFNTPSLSTSTTYYVEVINGTCTSSRTAVTASIFNNVSILSTTPDSRCDEGTLTLIATTESFGILSWFANSSGGTALATGNSFTTPVISTTTTYYVAATNGDCTTSRVAVTASILPTAAPTGNANQTFCVGEIVGLIAANGSNIIWYDAASGGTVYPNSSPLINGFTYYGSQTIGSCESPNRLAVTMTLGGCLGTDMFNFNQIKLYPNPVLDILKISSTQELSSIEIIDMLGRLLFRKVNTTFETEIDMSNLPTATYLVQIKVNNQVKTYKVIKR